MPIREATINDALEIALVQISSSQEAYKGILPTSGSFRVNKAWPAAEYKKHKDKSNICSA
jgi:hypothetical protein